MHHFSLLLPTAFLSVSLLSPGQLMFKCIDQKIQEDLYMDGVKGECLSSLLDSTFLQTLAPLPTTGTSSAPPQNTTTPEHKQQHPTPPALFHHISNQGSHRLCLQLEQKQPPALTGGRVTFGATGSTCDGSKTSRTEHPNAGGVEENDIKSSFRKTIKALREEIKRKFSK